MVESAPEEWTGTGGDVCGLRLSSSDRDRLHIFVQEFVTRGLLPFVERQMRLLNDQVVFTVVQGLHTSLAGVNAGMRERATVARQFSKLLRKSQPCKNSDFEKYADNFRAAIILVSISISKLHIA